MEEKIELRYFTDVYQQLQDEYDADSSFDAKPDEKLETIERSVWKIIFEGDFPYSISNEVVRSQSMAPPRTEQTPHPPRSPLERGGLQRGVLQTRGSQRDGPQSGGPQRVSFPTNRIRRGRGGIHPPSRFPPLGRWGILYTPSYEPPRPPDTRRRTRTNAETTEPNSGTNEEIDNPN
ncbi:hypothetical protein NHQ30_003215 [Ciborinia camelliae]|nr:hypothetical protein NHQ30_003215 [Ciborinia camelliae]